MHCHKSSKGLLLNIMFQNGLNRVCINFNHINIVYVQVEGRLFSKNLFKSHAFGQNLVMVFNVDDSIVIESSENLVSD